MNAVQRDDQAQHLGLLFLRVTGGLFLLFVHGLPKLLDFTAQLQVIEDPFHLGAWTARCRPRIPGLSRENLLTNAVSGHSGIATRMLFFNTVGP